MSAWLFYVRQGDKNQLYIYAASLALLLTLSLPTLYRRYQNSFLTSLLTDDRLRGLVGPVELTIDEEGIEERRGPMTIRARWSDIALENGAKHVIVRLAPLVAVLVPHAAFESIQAREAFVATVRARLTNRPS